MALSWLVKSVMAGIVTASLLGCSAQQAQSLGMRNSTVKHSPQQMTNLELCETYAYGRKAVHTRVAMASEWSRRGLSHSYCDKIRNELYLTTVVKKLANIEEQPASKKAKPVKPVN